MIIICTKRMGNSPRSYIFDDEGMAEFLGSVLDFPFSCDGIQFAILSSEGKVLKTNNKTRNWAEVLRAVRRMAGAG